MENKQHLKIYAIGAIVILVLIIIITVLITRSITLEHLDTDSQEVASEVSNLVKESAPAPEPSASASPVALVTTPPEASSQPSSIPTSPASEKPYGVFDPSEFTVTYSTAPAKDYGCGLKEEPLIVPQTIPKPSWDRVDDAILLPSNPETGPTKQTGPVRHCYAKSGAGLVYAAANHAYQSLIYEEFQTDEAQAITTLESFRASYAKEGVKKNNVGDRGDDSLKEMKPVGWDIITLDPENSYAEVFVYSKTEFKDGREGYAKSLVPISWDKGDWRIAGHIQTDPARGDFTGMRSFD